MRRFVLEIGKTLRDKALADLYAARTRQGEMILEMGEKAFDQTEYSITEITIRWSEVKLEILTWVHAKLFK